MDHHGYIPGLDVPMIPAGRTDALHVQYNTPGPIPSPSKPTDFQGARRGLSRQTRRRGFSARLHAVLHIVQSDKAMFHPTKLYFGTGIVS